MLVSDRESVDGTAEICTSQLSEGPAEWLMKKLYPEHPMPYVLAGVALVVASNLETFEDSPARMVMVALGGAALAFGGLPVLVQLFKGEKVTW